MKMPNSPEPTAKVHALTAMQVLDFISPDENKSLSLYETNWLFRGQTIDSPVIPRAHRPNEMRYWFPDAPEQPTCLDQLRFESMILFEFQQLSDQMGFPLPEDSIHLWWEKSALLSSSSGHIYYRSGELLPLIALAQHEGLPTRLVDFTRNPLVAAYFAAQPHVESDLSGSTTRVIWALRSEAVEFLEDSWRSTIGVPRPEFFVIRPLGASNARIRAQRGVLLNCGYDPESVDETGHFKPLDLEAGISKAVDLLHQTGGSGPPFPWLVKLMFPSGEAGRLLHLLSMRGIEGCTILPEWHGVLRSMHERRSYLPPFRFART